LGRASNKTRINLGLTLFPAVELVRITKFTRGRVRGRGRRGEKGGEGELSR